MSWVQGARRDDAAKHARKVLEIEKELGDQIAAIEAIIPHSLCLCNQCAQYLTLSNCNLNTTDRCNYSKRQKPMQKTPQSLKQPKQR